MLNCGNVTSRVSWRPFVSVISGAFGKTRRERMRTGAFPPGERRPQRILGPSYASAAARRPSSTQPSTPWLSFRLGGTI